MNDEIAPPKIIYVYTLSDPRRPDDVRYVGVTKDTGKRLKGHIEKSKREKTHKARWINSLLRDGVNPIMTEIDKTDEDNWVQCEIGWIAHYRGLGCNLVNGSDGGEGVMNPSEETRRKKSEATRGENHYMYGKHHSEESRKKMSESRSGENNAMYGKTHSEESRRKNLESQPHKRAIIQYSLDGSFIRQWDSARGASRELGIASGSIISCCRHKYGFNTAGGYIFRYADDPLLLEQPRLF